MDSVVNADPVQMHQVLINLCTNAAHAMRRKGGVLEISVTNAAFAQAAPPPLPDMKPGEYVVMEVRDTGHGMTREVKERIFDLFFTTKEQGEGTGLGLSVVHGIVHSHGGHITVESEVGKGSTFRVYLTKFEKAEARIEDTPDLPVPSGKECILFVDDEDTLVEMNKQRLSRLGYEVVATIDAREALDLFRREPRKFDLVITDYTMPHMTGMDLAAELLKLRRDIPIILCTGHSEDISPDVAKQAGIREFLMKPTKKRELAGAIRKALDKKNSV
jgi:CheY-like chemotaxis protein